MSRKHLRKEHTMMYEVRRTPEQGHTVRCLAKAIITAVENLRDESRTSDYYFRLAMQDNLALQLADEYLTEGMTECLCPPVIVDVEDEGPDEVSVDWSDGRVEVMSRKDLREAGR